MVPEHECRNQVGRMTEDLSAQKPTVQEISSALARTGFLLEHRVAQGIRPLGFDIEISRAYRDQDTGQSREIDVFAEIDRTVGKRPFNIEISGHVIIECKNNTGLFVLIGDCGRDYAYFDRS